MEHVHAGGARIPRLGLGTRQNTGEACVKTVRTALELGYRHVDTARVYGNEREGGEGIAAAEVDRGRPGSRPGSAFAPPQYG